MLVRLQDFVEINGSPKDWHGIARKWLEENGIPYDPS